MLIYNIDSYFQIYEVNPGDKICFAGPVPQIAIIPSDRFVVPLFYYEHSIDDNFEERAKETLRNILCHIYQDVICVKTEDDAIKEFKTMDLEFGQTIKINNYQSQLKFAISAPEYLGIFVGRTIPVNQIGAFVWLKSIIRIME